MRVKLSYSDQRTLIDKALVKFNSLKQLSIFLSVPSSTLQNYYQGVRCIPLEIYHKLNTLTDFYPEVILLPDIWGSRKGGERGIKALREKYPEKIKQWARHARSKQVSSHNKKSISKPALNTSLAEFIGIMIGDGTLTPYFSRISGDKRYDYPYFRYIQQLVYDLFSVDCTITSQLTTNKLFLTICSTELSYFLNKKFSLPFGDKIKNNAMIPVSLLNDPILSRACLRGLMDTDGTFARRGKNGMERCVAFSSHNHSLLQQVYSLGKALGVFTYFSPANQQIGTNSKKFILKYFAVVGSSNLRHIVRFDQWSSKGVSLYVSEVISYYQQPLYTELKLPFHTEPMV